LEDAQVECLGQGQETVRGHNAFLLEDGFQTVAVFQVSDHGEHFFSLGFEGFFGLKGVVEGLLLGVEERLQAGIGRLSLRALLDGRGW